MSGMKASCGIWNMRDRGESIYCKYIVGSMFFRSLHDKQALPCQILFALNPKFYCGTLDLIEPAI